MERSERRSIVMLAIAVEGGLVLLAFGLGWIAGIAPFESFAWRSSAVLWGLLGAIPVFLLFLVSRRIPVRPLEEISRFLAEILGPPLAACRWYELLLIAGLAGLGEEVLFRGTLQPWMESWGWGIVGALIASNVIFGLAHLITPLYAVWAGLIGVYLGLLLDASGERNLLIPVITHAVFDYWAFLVVIASVRHEQPPAPGEDSPEPADLAGAADLEEF